jgi:ribonuclease BN (tRNA processing enzyme)
LVELKINNEFPEQWFCKVSIIAWNPARFSSILEKFWLQMIHFTPMGTGDAFCTQGKLHTNFLLDLNGFQLLVDVGATAMMGIQKMNLKTGEIDAIVLSHLHGDHFGGLPFLFLHMQYIAKRTKPLYLFSPGHLEPKLEQLMQLLYPGNGLYELGFEVIMEPYEEEVKLAVGPFEVLPFRVEHSEPALPHGLQICAQQKKWVYSGDTRWTDRLIDAAKDADIFILDANFYSYDKAGHLDYLTIVSKLPLLKAKEIFLTHLGEEMWENRAKIELEILEEFKTYIL